MLKHKKFLSLSLILPIFVVFSCAKPKEPYEVIKDEKETHLKVDGNLPSQIESGKKIDISKITVTYDGNKLNWLGEWSREFKTEGKFFIVSDSTYPTNSIVTNLQVTTNVEQCDLLFYVSYFNKDEKKVYVSKTLKVKVINDKALKPWVWYTVTGVVVFAVVGMVVFTKRRKANKEK